MIVGGSPHVVLVKCSGAVRQRVIVATSLVSNVNTLAAARRGRAAAALVNAHRSCIQR